MAKFLILIKYLGSGVFIVIFILFQVSPISRV